MKHFLSILFITSSLVIIDQWTKSYFFSIPENMYIQKHLNQYFLFNSFKDAAPFIKYIATTFFFSTFVITFSFIDFFYFKGFKIIQFGIWILASGILGNIIDKIFYSGVRDFLILIPGTYTNFADIVQWIGLILFIFGIFKDHESVWKANSQRKRILVYPKEQLLFSCILSLLLSGSLFIILLISLSFFKFLNSSNLTKELYILTYLSVSSFLFVTTFIFSIFLSSRIWGPVYGYSKYLKGNQRKEFKSRKTDLLKIG